MIQNGISSVSGTNGELSHLTPSLFGEVNESFSRLDWVFDCIDEIAVSLEKG